MPVPSKELSWRTCRPPPQLSSLPSLSGSTRRSALLPPWRWLRYGTADRRMDEPPERRTDYVSDLGHENLCCLLFIAGTRVYFVFCTSLFYILLYFPFFFHIRMHIWLGCEKLFLQFSRFPPLVPDPRHENIKSSTALDYYMLSFFGSDVFLLGERLIWACRLRTRLWRFFFFCEKQRQLLTAAVFHERQCLLLDLLPTLFG